MELLWVHDEKEAKSGPEKGMCLAERAGDQRASPFGVIFNRKDDASQEMPFDGWKYQPVYFQPPWSFYVGSNSKNINEPLCVYMPFIEPGMPKGIGENELFKVVSKVTVYTPSNPLSNVLHKVNTADRLLVKNSNSHLMEVVFNENKAGLSHDFRPDIPLVVRW